jgi:hypothetical protein
MCFIASAQAISWVNIFGNKVYVPAWAVSAETGVDTNVSSLQTHVSYLLSHMSENVSIWIGLVGARMCPHVRSSPVSLGINPWL